MYVIKLLSGAFLVRGSVTWSPTMLQHEATRFKTEREAMAAGRKLLGGRPFSAVPYESLETRILVSLGPSGARCSLHDPSIRQ